MELATRNAEPPPPLPLSGTSSKDNAKEPECPYFVGNELVLLLESDHKAPQQVTARIEKVFSPFTWSSVMLVHLDSTKHISEQRAILKLYDRRFATGLRDEYRMYPWTPETEHEYKDFILSGGASSFVSRLQNTYPTLESAIYNDDEIREWECTHDETWINCRATELYNSEVEAYERLEYSQGTDVPRLLARFTTAGYFQPQTLQCQSTEEPLEEYLCCRGILLEYIPGFSLRDIASYAPRETWNYICQDAVRIASSLYYVGICNTDVCARNCIVRWDDANGRYKVLMIDLGCCTFRNTDGLELEWKSQKAMRPEDFMLAWELEDYVEQDFKSKTSRQSNKLSIDFMSIYNNYSNHRQEHRRAGCTKHTCRNFLRQWERRLANFYVSWDMHQLAGCSLCRCNQPCVPFWKQWMEHYGSESKNVRNC